MINGIGIYIPAIKNKKDFANQAVGYYYVGKSYWNLKKPEIALTYLKKVDSIFDSREYIKPDLLENYQLLINYYKSKDYLKSQLYYIEKLLKVDSIVDHKFKYLSSKINKEYDTKAILLEKKKIENILESRKHNDIIFSTIIAMLFLSILLVSFLHIRNKNSDREKFEESNKGNRYQICTENKKLPELKT